MQHNNKAKISRDVLYGGIVDYCFNTHEFLEFFNYSKQTCTGKLNMFPVYCPLRNILETYIINFSICFRFGNL